MNSVVSAQSKRIQKGLVENSPFLFAVMLYLFITLSYVHEIIKRVGLIFVYPIDDAYISMALARNIAQYGVWGVDKFTFASASSGILWTIVSAFIGALTNFYEGYPLILNIIFSILTIWYVNRVLKSIQVFTISRLVVSLVTVVLIPLPIISIAGVETPMHVFLTLLFVDQVSKSLSAKYLYLNWKICLIAALLVSCRYEGLFTVIVAAGIYIVRRHFKEAVTLLTCGALPIILFGIYSCCNGSYFLPNPIILKGHIDLVLSVQPIAEVFRETKHNWFDTWGSQLFYPVFNLGLMLLTLSLLLPYLNDSKGWRGVMGVLQGLLLVDIFLRWGHVLGLFPAASVSGLELAGSRLAAVIGLGIAIPSVRWTVMARQTWTRANVWLIIFVFNFLIHMLTARTGWFFRYEAYLIAMIIMAMSFSRQDSITSELISPMTQNKTGLFRKAIMFCFFCLACGQFVPRTVTAFTSPVTNALAIYRQQYQFAHFVNRYFHNDCIMANDIGALSFFNDSIRIIDIVGLANNQALKARVEGTFNSAFVDQLSRRNNCQCIIVYDSWLNHYGGAPKDWIKVGTWTVDAKDSYLGSEMISFYALTDEKAKYIAKCMREFHLPAAVDSKIFSQAKDATL